MPQRQRLARREFLKRTAATAAGLVGFPTIVPGSALGLNGATPPSERIQMGAIGLGRMGGGDARGFLQQEDVRMVAVCDAQQARREQAKSWVDQKYGDQQCATYEDYRELLARKDIDAVVIATGERWHPLIGIEAARQGKHMYCEKPLALAVDGAKAVRAAVERHGVVFQFGTQQRSSFYFRHARDLVRGGKIGQLRSIALACAPLAWSVLPPEQPAPVPPGVDWDMWLGPAPWAPYSDLRISLNWLDIYDYGLGGMGGSWGVHDVDIAQWVNDSDHTTPISVEGTGDFYRDIRDTASTYDIEYTYANGVLLRFMDLQTARKRVPQFQYGNSEQRGFGLVISGTEGWIWVSREGVRAHSEVVLRSTTGPVERGSDHKRNFLDAIKTGRQTISPIQAAAHDEMICQMGDIAIRVKRKLRWDPVKEVFLDDEVGQPETFEADAQPLEARMMSKKAILGLFALAIGAATLAGQAQSPKAMRTVAEMEPVLSKIAAFDHGQDREVLAEFRDFVHESMGSPAQLKQIEARLLRFLQSDATPAGKDFVFQELSLIATDTSISVLTPMLARAETTQMARYVLARIPGPAADEALRKSLDKVTGRVKIGIINSLGERRDTGSVSVLAALAADPTPGISQAAVAALANIADRPALEALAAARSKSAAPLREQVSEAYATCADRFAARGDRITAARVYRQLLAPQEPQTVRIRALAGLAATDGTNAVPALTAAIESTDPKLQAAAIQFLNRIPGRDITDVLMKEFQRLPGPGQVRLLSALEDRGDVSAKPLLMAAAKTRVAEVRVAALLGLGRLGDASSVVVLAEAAAASPGPEQDAARQSLYGLQGPAINPAILAAIGSSSGKVKAELIMAAGERGDTAAADALAKAVQGPDPDVRREALRALRNVAGAAQIPALLDLLLKASTASERRDATQTLASVLRRSRPTPIGPVISAYKATSAVESRVSLLEVMGQTSNDEALPLLRSSLADPNPEIRRAAILALSAWDNSAPLPDLLAVAKSDANPVAQVLALRGYLNLVALSSQRSAAETARLLGETLRLASQPAEKRTVLSLLQTYPCQESLKLAESSLGDETVAKEARMAVDRISAALKLR